MARATCMYCGASLSAEVLEQAAQAAKRVLQSKSLVHLEQAARGVEASQNARRHVVIDTSTSPVGAIASACAVSLWEAGQWQAAGRYRLLRVTTEPAGGPQEQRLQEQGVPFFILTDETLSVSRSPVAIESIDSTSTPIRSSLREDPDKASLRRDLTENDLAIVLTAPIRREKVKEAGSRRAPADTRLEDAWLVHLHLKTGGRPLELDIRRTAFEGTGLASAYIRALELVRRLSNHVTLDESFRNVVPALSPGEDPLIDLARTNPGKKSREKEQKLVVLDNVAQFRDYSAWRGALEVLLLNERRTTL